MGGRTYKIYFNEVGYHGNNILFPERSSILIKFSVFLIVTKVYSCRIEGNKKKLMDRSTRFINK